MFHFFLIGFRRRIDASTSSQIIYYRKGKPKSTFNSMVKTSSSSPPKPEFHTNEKNGYPLVFVHGIGIGYAHYLYFITTLPSEIDVYLIEWPHVAMQVS